MNIHEGLTALEVMPQREHGNCSPPWGAAENTCTSPISAQTARDLLDAKQVVLRSFSWARILLFDPQ